MLVALRSLSLKPISFGYKTPPIRFSQAGGQSAHKARPPNLELALTPLMKLFKTGRIDVVKDCQSCFAIDHHSRAVILKEDGISLYYYICLERMVFANFATSCNT